MEGGESINQEIMIYRFIYKRYLITIHFSLMQLILQSLSDFSRITDTYIYSLGLSCCFISISIVSALKSCPLAQATPPNVVVTCLK